MPSIKERSIGCSYNKRSGLDSWKFYNSFYGTKKWTDLKRLYIHEHPLCEICMKHGRTVEAEEIHHKIPWTRGKDEDKKTDLFLDYNNLMSLCKKCHKAVHRKDDGFTPLISLSDNEYEKEHQTRFFT